MKWPPVGREENQISPEVFDLLNRFLTFDPAKRLGSNGIHEIKDHPFFADIIWEKVRDEIPPFVPYVKNDTDTSNFREEKANFRIDSLIDI